MELNQDETQLGIDIVRAAETLKPVASLYNFIWVYDIDNSYINWCSHGVVDVWQADSMEEFIRRNSGSDNSVDVAKKLKQYQADLTADYTVQFKDTRTLYPKGKPTTSKVVFSSSRLNTDRICKLCEAIGQKPIDIEGLCSSEALLHTSVNNFLYSGAGKILH